MKNYLRKYNGISAESRQIFKDLANGYRAKTICEKFPSKWVKEELYYVHIRNFSIGYYVDYNNRAIVFEDYINGFAESKQSQPILERKINRIVRNVINEMLYNEKWLLN